jgi:hypothetical protein
MSNPCECHACVLAGVGRRSVTIPEWRGTPAQELHGRDLQRFYEAQDGLRAALAKIKGSTIELAVSKALPAVKP